MSRKLKSPKGTTPVLLSALEQILILISLFLLCKPSYRNTSAETPSVTKTAATQNNTARINIQLREISKQAGLSGITICGSCEKLALVEVNCGGLCWFDYDNDGFLDLFVTSGASLQDLIANRSGQPGGQRGYLYRNNRNGTFTDVTEKAGIRGQSWAQGCAAADFDNDGEVDLFVSNIGQCFLYRNQGDGTFGEIAQKAGVAGGFNWHTGAAFGDYDGDGFLDLYVAAYVDLPSVLDKEEKCTWKGVPTYCGPVGMKGGPDKLYRNNGNGTFEDVTKETGVEDRDLLYGFTASFEDFDNDGKLDIFVANDLGRNYLYHNLGGGKFEEVGQLWGLAYPTEGNPQANMGVAIADYDHDGTMDLFVTTFANDHYTLYRNMGKQLFMDVSTESGIGLVTVPFLGWGTFFADLDNDGSPELFAANGHVYPAVDRVAGLKQGFAQRPLLFRLSRPGVFEEIGQQAGLTALKTYSSRGAAFADFDNDGDIDIVYSNLGAAPTLLQNITPTDHQWITIKTIGTKSNRDGVGTRLRMKAGELTQYETVRSGESYLSGNDPRVHFGLGSRAAIDELEIRWPSGHVDVLQNIRGNQIITIQEGKGIIRELFH